MRDRCSPDDEGKSQTRGETRRGYGTARSPARHGAARRGGSSNDAEITERVRARPTIIEWESSGRRGGGVYPPSEGKFSDTGAVWWPHRVPFCCRPLGATAAWFATVFLYLRRSWVSAELRTSDCTRSCLSFHPGFFPSFSLSLSLSSLHFLSPSHSSLSLSLSLLFPRGSDNRRVNHRV